MVPTESTPEHVTVQHERLRANANAKANLICCRLMTDKSLKMSGKKTPFSFLDRHLFDVNLKHCLP